MEIISYSIDLNTLFSIQDKETENNIIKANTIKEEGLKNKVKLLKIVLPYIHSVYALHNRKCKNENNSITGKRGLLGLDPYDIDKEINRITTTECRFTWNDNFSTFIFDSGKVKTKIWLNDKRGAYIHNPKLDYSMTSIIEGKTYADSIQDELIEIARICSKYQDSW